MHKDQLINGETFAYPVFPTKAVREQWFRSQLATAPWAVWGLLTIYSYQTAGEQAADTVTDHNGVGFTGIDGEFLSSLAKQWTAKGFLSPKQLPHLLKKLPKYAAQLIGHLEGKGVNFVIDKKAALLADIKGEGATLADDVENPGPSVLFGEASASIGDAPAGPDWEVYRTLLGVSYKVAHPGIADAYKALVAQYIGGTDDFAQAVWKSITAKLPQVPSYRQAKVIAIACAKVAVGVPCLQSA